MLLSEISIKRETIDSFYSDAKELFVKDWEETTRDGIEFDIDEATYRKYEQAGRLFIITARFQEKLIGYIGFTLTESLHHKLKMANCSGLFVEKQYRGRTGTWLVLAAKDMLRASGIDKMRISTSTKNNVSKLFEKYGMISEEVVYGLMLYPPKFEPDSQTAIME